VESEPAERKAGASSRTPHEFSIGLIIPVDRGTSRKTLGKLAGKRAERSHKWGQNEATGRLAGKRSNPAAFRPKARARGGRTKVRKMW